MSDLARVRIRKTGAKSWPWEVRCTACREERTHFIPLVGAVVVNTRGIGNRLFDLALMAGLAHLREAHNR